MTREKKNCEWCKDNNYRCQSDEVVVTCDFRTLPRSSSAVIERMRFEKDFIEKMKVKMEKNANTEENHNLLKEMFDRIAGITIMTNVLVDEFKMTKEEVRDAVGFKETSWAEKMKLVTKLKLMQKTRGRK